MSKSDDKLSALLDSMDESRQLAALENRFAYLFAKADLFLRMGLETYLEKDFFDWSGRKFDDDEINELRRGCQQILEGKGLTSDNPLTLSIGGFYSLFEIFHFSNTGRVSTFVKKDDGNYFLDKMEMEHVMDKDKITYYNLVKSLIE